MNDDHLKWVTASLCCYETIAIVSGRVPTISRFTSRHKWLQPILVSALSAHLVNYDRSH